MVARTGSRREEDKRGSFRYKERSADDVHKRATQSGGNFDSPFVSGVDVFRPQAGDNYIRILPPTWEDADHYGMDAFMHRFVGGNNSNYLCLNKQLGKPCAACDEYKEVKASGEEEEAKQLEPKKRVIMYVLDRDDRSKTPLLWDVSWNQDREIASLCENKRTGNVLLLDHPDEGYDIIVKKSGQGMRTKYQFVIDRERSPIDKSQKVQDDILKFIEENPIPDMLRYDDNEYIAKQLEGGTQVRDPDLDKDDKDDDRGSRRGRGRDKDDDKEERGSRNRRGRDDDKEERGSSRRGQGRDDNDDEIEEDRPRSRRDRDEDQDEEKDEGRSSRGRGRDRDEGKDDNDDRSERGRGRDRDRDREDDSGDDRPSRGRGRGRDEKAEDDEKPARRERLTRDKDDDKEDDDRGSRRRDRDDDKEDDDRGSRRGSRDRDDDKDDDREERSSRRGRDRDEDEERPRRSRR